VLLAIPTQACASDSKSCLEAKAIAAQAIANATTAEALATEAYKKRDDAITQRDEYRVALDLAQTDRDWAAGQLTLTEKLNQQLSEKREDLLIQNAKLEAAASRSNTIYWITLGIVAVASGAASAVITAQVFK
jgi:hypothetical protein